MKIFKRILRAAPGAGALAAAVFVCWPRAAGRRRAAAETADFIASLSF